MNTKDLTDSMKETILRLEHMATDLGLITIDAKTLVDNSHGDLVSLISDGHLRLLPAIHKADDSATYPFTISAECSATAYILRRQKAHDWEQYFTKRLGEELR